MLALARSTARPAFLGFALAMFAAACGGGGGDGGETPTGPGPAASVDFSSSSFTFVAIGASQAVTATVRDAQGRALSSAQVSWNSDNAAIADVEPSGRSATIIARKTGSTTIRVSSGSITGSINILILGVRSVAVSPASAGIRVGETQTLSATLDSDNGVSRSVVWSSDNPSIATVSSQGVVTGVGAGSAVIRASAVADPQVSGTAEVLVAPLRGVIVGPATSNIAAGATQQLTAVVAIDAGLPTGVTWSSSAPSVATVNQQGLVTGVAVGSTTITATSVADVNLKANAVVNVVPTVQQVSVSAPSPQMFMTQSQTLTATVTADAGLAKTVTWSTSSVSIANVNASGVVTATGLGTATITATSTVDQTKRGTVSITVVPRQVNVSIAPAGLVLAAATTGSFVATVDADPGVSQAVNWQSSAPSVATVSNGLVTAVSSGSAQITATSVADPTKSATATVTVTPRLATAWSASALGGSMVENLTSVYAISNVLAYAVNSRGDVYRFDGTSWTRAAQGSAYGTTFTAVHGTGANNVIAVGTSGKIVAYNGANWQVKTSGTTSNLNDVWVESATSAIAVGSGGVAVRLTGTTWAATNTSSVETLYGVWAGGGNVWFAVGAHGEMLKYTGTVWTRTTWGSQATIYDVFGVSATDAYAVGAGGTVLHYNGIAWSAVSTNGVDRDLYSIAGVTSGISRYYIGGDRIALQIVSGIVDTVTQSTPYDAQFLSASVDPSGNLWLGGERGMVLRYASNTWETVNIAADLMDVWSTSTTNSWAVGEFGFIYRFNGSQWSREVSPTLTRLNAVWAPDASEAFAGGDEGTILHWNGTAWTAMGSPSTSDVMSLWGTSGTNVYATTYAGEILHYNGSAWNIETSVGIALFTVYGVSANEVYAAGDQGTVLKLTGGNWTLSNTGPNALLWGLWASGPTNIVAVGGLGPLGAAYRFNTSWQSLNVSGIAELTSIWGPNATDLYSTSAVGSIHHFDGITWQTMATGTTEHLWSVSGDPNGQGGAFAVGFNSTLVTGLSSGLAMASRVGVRAQRASFEPSPAALLARDRSHHEARSLPQGQERESLKRMHARAPSARPASAKFVRSR